MPSACDSVMNGSQPLFVPLCPARATKIIVDDLDCGPAELTGAIGETILPARRRCRDLAQQGFHQPARSTICAAAGVIAGPTVKKGGAVAGAPADGAIDVADILKT